MQDISIIDETFDENISSSYFLSIQISLDGFCFCTLDPIRNKYIQFHQQSWKQKSTGLIKNLDDYISEFKFFAQEDSILKLSFKKVFILVSNPDFAIIPNVLFAKDKMETLFKLSHILREEDELLSNRVKLVDATIIYPLTKKWKEMLTNSFLNVQIFHTHTSTLEALSLFHKSSKIKNTLTLCFENKSFDVFAFSESNLMLGNHFDFNTDADFLYYFLYVFEQLKFTNDNMELFVIGDIEPDSSLLLLLRQYIKRVNFKQVSKSITFSYHFKDVLQYSKFSLFNIPLCVS